MTRLIHTILLVILCATAHGQFGLVGNAGAIFPPGTSSGYLPETDAFLASDACFAGLDDSVKEGIDRWFRDMKGEANTTSWNGTSFTGYTTYNKYSSLIAVYLMVCGTSTSVAVNAVNPGTYTLTHTASPTISSNGIAYNGTTQYSSTGFTPSNSTDNTDLVCHGVHRRDANEDANATIGIAHTGNSYHLIRSDNYRIAHFASQVPAGSAGTLAVAALWVGSYNDGTTVNYYRNGTKIKTLGSAPIWFAGASPYLIGACNDGAIPYVFGGANDVDHVMLAKGYWSDAEQAAYSKAFYALQQKLGR